MVSASPSPHAPSAEEIQNFRSHLLAGKPIVLPTETVPGVGVFADSADAARALAALKGAPGGRPFSLHLRNLEELKSFIPCPPPGLAPWLQRVLPGPLTVVLPVKWLDLPFEVPWPALGFRLPGSEAYSRWMDHAPGPVWMTSINPHGQPPLQGGDLFEWLQERTEIWNGLTDEDSPNQGAEASAVVEFTPTPFWHRGEDRFVGRMPGMRILCLCTGNTCRSPLAEVLLRQEVAAAWGVPQVELDALGWTIESAGTSVISASPANGNSVAAASEVGLDLSSHRSQNLELALQKPWDLVLGMSATHLGLLPPNTPCALFDPTGGEVPDPFGQEMSIYRLTRDHLQEACLGWAQSWSRWPESGQTYVTAGG